MSVLTPLNEVMQVLADEHRRWLANFDPQYIKNWEKLFLANDESAMAEADVRHMLQQQGVAVKPNEDLTGDQKCPDFCCDRNGRRFYVEVTHISIAKATEKTGIDNKPGRGCSPFRPLNDAVFEACRGKTKQCSGADAPVLLAVGTWHGFAAMVSFRKVMVNMLLTGKTNISWNIDSTGGPVGSTYQTTKLDSAAFLKPDLTESFKSARNSISGLLLVAHGMTTWKPLGILHPNAVRPFDPSLLPEIEFGSVVIDSSLDRLDVQWPRAIDE